VAQPIARYMYHAHEGSNQTEQPTYPTRSPMSDQNEVNVPNQGLPGSGERDMQTCGAGGSLSSQAPIASLELPASDDQQEQQQQQQQQSLTLPTTGDAADPSFDPSRSEARQRPDQLASKRAKTGSAAQEQCCTQCPITNNSVNIEMCEGLGRNCLSSVGN
jgi:hypothetical protein